MATKKTAVKKVKIKPENKVSRRKTKAKPKTYVSMILDCSSSMGTIRDEAISMFNQQVENLKKAKGQDITISLTTFNNIVDHKFFNQPVKDMALLTSASYCPSGCTAMLDAIGHSIEQIETKCEDLEKENVAVLFLIVTDGFENASREFTRDEVSKKIEQMQGTGKWTFTYLGANQNAHEIAQSLNIPVGNAMTFVADSNGMLQTSDVMLCSTANYTTLRGCGITQASSFYSDDSKDLTNKSDITS